MKMLTAQERHRMVERLFEGEDLTGLLLNFSTIIIMKEDEKSYYLGPPYMKNNLSLEDIRKFLKEARISLSKEAEKVIRSLRPKEFCTLDARQKELLPIRLPYIRSYTTGPITTGSNPTGNNDVSFDGQNVMSFERGAVDGNAYTQ